MAEQTDHQALNRMFAHLDELHLVGIERRLKKGEYVSADELAAALRKHGSRPIPPALNEYLCRVLEDKVGKPRGRKALPPLEKRRREMLVRGLYQRYFTRLRNRKARYGRLHGWSGIEKADWWQGPPHERAARMVAKKLHYGAESWRAVLNAVSSQK